MTRVLDLFSGIGGFSLGLEAVGMSTVAFCEQDAYAAAVLRKHWPDTPIYPDVRQLDAAALRRDGIGPIDLVCGGFPCQDISLAGKGAGIEGERSGLWAEMHRIIHELRPAWVIAENVPALRSRGSDRVLSDLEGSGYTAWPVVVGALHAGAPHRRQRVWIVAHASGEGRRQILRRPHGDEGPHGPQHMQQPGGHGEVGDVADVAYAPKRGARRDGQGREQEPAGGPADVGIAGRARLAQRQGPAGEWPHAAAVRADWWSAEPGVGRVAHGVPRRVDRLKCLGNAVVPQVVTMIGAWIMQQEQAA